MTEPSHDQTPRDPAAEMAHVKAMLQRLAGRIIDGGQTIENLKRLSGGASQETWSFDCLTDSGEPTGLILRRAPGGKDVSADQGSDMGTSAGLAREAAIIRRCADHGVAVPGVPYVMAMEDGLGPAYVMTRVAGETIPRKILRDPEFAQAREVLAWQCGATLARIHAVPLEGLPDLDTATARDQWQRYFEIYNDYAEPKPMFEYAFAWLREHLPSDTGAAQLVHGDFRNGNLMIGTDGVRAVLDWELTHLGDPMEDLGWICINSWRFGNSHKIVGGFGDLDDLIAGYEAHGGTADRDRVRFWIVFGTLKWGIICMSMVNSFRTGAVRTVERAAIGRRTSETEIDLVNLLLPKA